MDSDSGKNSKHDVAKLGDNAQHADHNFRLGVFAGTFAGTAQDFVHPELILAGLIYALTGSVKLVALVTIVNKACMLAPQLLISSLVEHSPRRRPQFIVMTIARVCAFLCLVVGMWLMSSFPTTVTFTIFFIIYGCVCMTTSGSHVIYVDMVGRLIPPGKTGTYIGMRNFFGGALAMVAGLLVIQPILSRVELPWNYLLLALIGTMLVLMDMATWCQCREEPGPKAKNPTTLGESLKRGFRWLRKDHNYRCYLIQRVGFRISLLGLTFFIPYGAREITYQNPVGGIAILGGIMVTIIKLSRISGGLLWGNIADKIGSKFALMCGGIFFILAPLLALVAAKIPLVFSLEISRLGTFTMPLVVYLMALGLMGLAMQANMVAGQRFLILSAPLHRRASYIAFPNTVTSPLTLLPLLGAYIADTAGMQVLFLCVAAGGLISLFGSMNMKREGG